MARRLNVGRSSLPALVGAVVLAIACGSGTDGTSPSPSTTGDPGAGGGDAPPTVELEAPGPWAPSRALALDRFALEAALQSALREPVGAELSEATVWTLGGEGVEARLAVRTWFSGAEAEAQCAAAAGDGAEQSLALGTPVWTSADAVHLTRDVACVRVTVVRGTQPDLAAAGAVAAALVSGE